MSQGPHDPFLASTAAVAPPPVMGWRAYLLSVEAIVAIIVAVAEGFVLSVYAPAMVAFPLIALLAIALGPAAIKRGLRWTWPIVAIALAGATAAILVRAPISLSLGMVYLAIFAGMIALAQSGRILLALVLAVLVCAGTTLFFDIFQTQVSYGKDTKVIVLASMWAMGEGKQPILENTVADFEKANPDYKVIVRWDGRYVVSKNRPRLLTGKDVPDLIEGSKEELRILAQEDYVVPLDAYMNADSPFTGKPWKDDWIPAIYELGRYRLKPIEIDGKLRPNPLEGKLVLAGGIIYDYAFFYNKVIAHRLGIDEMPRTWDEFLAACQKAKDAGVDPIMLDAGYQDLMVTVLLQDSVPDDELRKTILGLPGHKPFTDPIYQRIFALDREVADKYLMRGWAASDWPGAQSQFATGHGLFILCGSWLPGELAETAVKDPSVYQLGCFPFPHFSDEPGGNPVIDTSGWMVLKGGSETRGAIRLLQYISDHWGRRIALEDGNPVGFARDPIPPALEGIRADLTDVKHVSTNPVQSFAPKWLQYIFLQKHEDFLQAKPGDKNYQTASQFLEDLQAATAQYQRDGAENKWK